MLTQEKEITYTHLILSHMAKHNGASFYIFDGEEEMGYNSYEAEMLLRILQQKQIVAQSGNSHGAIYLTPQGLQIARHPGGYRGYVEAEQERLRRESLEESTRRAREVEQHGLTLLQHERETEQLKLNRKSTEAATSSAHSSIISAQWAKRSGWAAILGGIVAVASLCFSFYTYRQSEQQNSVLEKRLQVLESQAAMHNTAPTQLVPPTSANQSKAR